AIPDLWVEQFLVNPDPLAVLAAVVPAGVGETPLSGIARAGTGAIVLASSQETGPFLDRAGLNKDVTRITLKHTDGSTRTLLVGKTSKVNTRTQAPPPPAFPMAPQPAPKMTGENSYCPKLANTPPFLKIRGNNPAEVWPESNPPPPDPKDPLAKIEPPTPGKPIDQLRDPNPLRFESEQVVGVTIAKAGQMIELKKTKANPKAESEAARKERWDIVSPFTGLAEPKQVTDLLDALERVSAKKNEIVDLQAVNLLPGGAAAGVLAADGLTPDQATTVTVNFDPESGIPPRSVKIGRH